MRVSPFYEPAVELAPSAAAAEDEVICAICLAPNLSLHRTGCQHTFCHTCIGVYALCRASKREKDVPCPLCRTPLGFDDFPEPFTVTLHADKLGLLGFSLASARGGPHAQIMAVDEASPAAKAGVRTGMWLLAIDDVPIKPDELAVCTVERLRAALATAGYVRLRIGWLVPASFAEEAPALAADIGEAGTRPAPVEYNASGVLCCCCCNVAGQLWQRVMRTRRWQCVAVAGTLWLFALVGLLRDVVPAWVRGYDARGEGLTIDVIDLSDGVDNVGEVRFLMGLMLVPFYALLVLTLCLVRRRLERDEPARWRVLVAARREEGWDGDSALCRFVDHALCCCCFAGRMLATFVPLDRYRPCTLLPTDALDDEEAAARGPPAVPGRDDDDAATAHVPSTTSRHLPPPASPPPTAPVSASRASEGADTASLVADLEV